MRTPIGAIALPHNRCQFRVWAPLPDAVTLQIWDSAEAKQPRSQPLAREDFGYWSAVVDDVKPGALYQFQLSEEVVRPDPASRYQPEDVHGRSQVVDQTYAWQDDAWENLPLDEYICYELHVGTFTPEGTFEAIIPRLADLRELGVNAIELMPVSQFPGDRNWGYDGAYPFAVQTSYGGVEGLKRLVDTCHQQGIAVILDVVYNHFGPEGNYTRDFAPYFTHHYNTPWGAAINFDDAGSFGVRNYVIENALYWLREFHIDALRLDAIHAIYDFGAKHILAAMAEAVSVLEQEQGGRAYYLIAESDLNDGRIIRPHEQGGYGLEAQWSDDFHHCVHALLTGESSGYYADFGTVEHLAQAWTRSFVYNGRYSPFRQRWHGNDVSDRPGSQFVVCVQNHDQVGNRMLGERLSQLTSYEGLKLAAATLLLAPAIPMLFMGEEYGETAPFLYFISHTDPDLVQAVREGRRREFADFHLEGEPPDAASQATFERCVLHWNQRHQGHHGTLWRFYQTLIAQRRSHPALTNFDRQAMTVDYDVDQRWLLIQRRGDSEAMLICMNWNETAIPLPPLPSGDWEKRLDSAAQDWEGPGSTLPDHLSTKTESALMPPLSVALYERIEAS
jgi:maltooligosyltrehalose trehalohydrolase